MGAVSTAGLKGEALANSMMKATTKSKRRVTLSICGLGMLDETEIDSIPASAKGRAPVVMPQARSAAPVAADADGGVLDQGDEGTQPGPRASDGFRPWCCVRSPDRGHCCCP